MDAGIQSENDIALATTPAPAPDVSPELALLYALEDCGAKFPDPPASVALIEQAFESAGDLRGAEALKIIFQQLPGGRRGTELRMALTEAVGFDAEAERLDMSRQSLFQAVQRLKKRLFRKKRLPATP